MICGSVPVPGGRITSAFGQRGPHFHQGVDIKAPEGTPVRSVLPGRVLAVSPSGRWDRYGHTIVVDHGAVLGFVHLVSLSAHLGSLYVFQGQHVMMGQALGHVGRSAGTRANPSAQFDQSSAHLHLEFFAPQKAWSLNAPRIDAAQVLAELGIFAQPGSGALVSSCFTAPPLVPSSSPIVPPPPPVVTPDAAPRVGTRATIAELGILALLGYLAWRWRHAWQRR